MPIEQKERNKEVVALYNEGLSYGKIALKLDLNRSIVAGIISREKTRGTLDLARKEARDKKIFTLYLDDRLTIQAISKQFNLSVRNINNVLQKYTSKEVRQERLKKSREKFASARKRITTLEEKEEVKRQQQSGIAINKIAANMKMSNYRIRDILKEYGIEGRTLKIKSNLTNLPLRAKPIKPTVQSVEPPPKTTKTKLADGIRGILPPKCKYELHNVSQSLKLDRKNPEYVWCPNEIVKGNWCAEHYAVCHSQPKKGVWTRLDKVVESR